MGGGREGGRGGTNRARVVVVGDTRITVDTKIF